MKVARISVANIEVARNHSASVHACELVRDLLREERPDVEVEIIPLLDYEMKPCACAVSACTSTLRAGRWLQPGV
jgi:hypothetical protein